jgi:hypothetical protein
MAVSRSTMPVCRVNAAHGTKSSAGRQRVAPGAHGDLAARRRKHKIAFIRRVKIRVVAICMQTHAWQLPSQNFLSASCAF